jgi:hypothetical protein
MCVVWNRSPYTTREKATKKSSQQLFEVYTSSAAAATTVKTFKISHRLCVDNQHTKHGEIDDSNGRFCP